ncbi:MAG: hypothetical protein IT435_03915 [Phycisphaerales bacterium]|nr:hypothetical protein [Phycisphaerales bacterium]
MIDRASADGRKHIVENLKKYQESPLEDLDEEPVKKEPENPFVKKQEVSRVDR